MGRIDITRTIGAPVADVHAFVVDPYALPRWMPMIRKVTEVEGQLRSVGTEFHAQVDVAGRLLDTRWRVVDVDPPTTTVLEVTSESEGRAEVAITLGDLEGDTEAQLDATYDLPGGAIIAFVDRLFVERTIARQAARALDLLRALAEG